MLKTSEPVQKSVSFHLCVAPWLIKLYSEHVAFMWIICGSKEMAVTRRQELVLEVLSCVQPVGEECMHA